MERKTLDAIDEVITEQVNTSNAEMEQALDLLRKSETEQQKSDSWAYISAVLSDMEDASKRLGELMPKQEE